MVILSLMFGKNNLTFKKKIRAFLKKNPGNSIIYSSCIPETGCTDADAVQLSDFLVKPEYPLLAGTPSNYAFSINIVQGDTFFKDLLRHPLGREGVYAQVGMSA